MRVMLFRAFPDPYRVSMTVYADRLQEQLEPLLGTTGEVKSYLPSTSRLTVRVARYWYQYVRYQLSARTAQADINHITDQAYAHLVHALDASRTVLSFHDGIGLLVRADQTADKPPLIRQLLRAYNLAAFRRTAAVICDSEAARRDLLAHADCHPSRVHVVPLGVAPTFFEDAPENARSRFGLPSGPYVLHVGHTGSYKNIPALLHVLAAVALGGVPAIRLLKIGTPFTDAQVRLADELGVSDRIVHLGYVPRDRLSELYRCADVLLFPSWYEGFGLPILEAMACGVPVVASNLGALPEVVGEAGFLAAPDDHLTMAEQVVALLENTALRTRLVDAGRRRARDFTWQRTAERTLEVYRQVRRSLE